jgi:predicted double-glycine peptidase
VVRQRSALAAFGLALLAGCRAPHDELRASDAHEELFIQDEAPIPAPARMLAVPLVRQRTAFSCGDVAVLAILRYYEPDRYGRTSETSLYGPLHTTAEQGTEPQPMAAYLSREPGLAAEARWTTPASAVGLEDLERAVDRGEPTIVAVQAWQPVSRVKDQKPWATDWDDGHYLVVIGYDAQNLYFMDPSTDGHYTYIPAGEFMDRWHDVLGGENAHAAHIAIFVHASAPPPSAPPAAAPGRATYVH